jgi:hypothetical protein
MERRITGSILQFARYAMWFGELASFQKTPFPWGYRKPHQFRVDDKAPGGDIHGCAFN